MRTSSGNMLAFNRGLKPRHSPSGFNTHLLLTLLALFLFFEILRLPTLTSAIPIDHVARRRDDSGPNDPSIYNDAIDSSVDSSEYFKRGVGEDIKTTFQDMGHKIKSFFVPAAQRQTPVEFVSKYAYDELDEHVPLKKLKEKFEKNYDGIDNKEDEKHWVHEQLKNKVPELKKTYDDAEKARADSKYHNKRDQGDKP